ncbi:MAG TPA: phosphotransferase, partial [Casimicrobiaceae bacterium]|nr:phosphotransferase [Casimicrobiaceae bacterium]
NVLFTRASVSGIIDFGFAATDFLGYDLAIAVNDWCVVQEGDDAGALIPEHARAMTDAYRRERPMSPDECAQWPALLRAAALRFWLSRLYDLHLPRPGELTHAHDPAHFERILRARAGEPSRWPLPAGPTS